MAGKVFVHATVSLDGFIADPDGKLDWAFQFAGPSPEAVREITGSIGAVLAGRHGYDLGMMQGDKKVYGGAWSGPQFVLTHRPADAQAGPSITFVSGGIGQAAEAARAAAGGKDVVVMGASIAQQCLAEGLADEILLHVVPILLGAREDLVMTSGTFSFITGGAEAALDHAKAAAGGKNVLVHSPSVAQQLLRAGLLDEIHLHLVPVLLGAGHRLFDHIGAASRELQLTKVIKAPDVTHLRYRPVR